MLHLNIHIFKHKNRLQHNTPSKKKWENVSEHENVHN